MSPKEKGLQETVLGEIQRTGRVKPADLVSRVSKLEGAPPNAVRAALRVLVDQCSIGLNWHGEFEAAKPTVR